MKLAIVHEVIQRNQFKLFNHILRQLSAKFAVISLNLIVLLLILQIAKILKVLNTLTITTIHDQELKLFLLK